MSSNDKRMPGASRREVLRGLLSAGVGLGLAAACGDSGGASGSTGGAGGTGGTGAGGRAPEPDAATGGNGGSPPDAGPRRPRVAIVGAGSAGVTLAWLLDGDADVTLFEAEAEVGGNVKAVALPGREPPALLDLGAQYFNPRTHETFARLLTHLDLFDPMDAARQAAQGVRLTASTMTIFGAGEAEPRFVSPARPDRLWALQAPWNGDGIGAFAALSAAGVQMERDDAPWDVTVQTFLEGLSITEAQRERILLPLAAAVNNGDLEIARTLSARAAFTFVSRNVPASPLDPVTNYVMLDGLGAAHRKMLGECTTVTVRTRARVASVGSAASGDAPLRVTLEGGESLPFDQVVLAVVPRDPAAFVGGVQGAGEVVTALQGVETYPTTMMLHADPAYAPADAMHHSLLNARIDGGFCEASMSVGVVLPPGPDGAPVDLWKSWTTHRSAPPAQILAQAEFRHLLTTPRTIAAAARINTLQGTAGMSFCGTYTAPVDSQDTAVESALRVAEQIAAQAAHLRAFVPA
jgi:predicted NAD/FAD-binding protein